MAPGGSYHGAFIFPSALAHKTQAFCHGTFPAGPLDVWCSSGGEAGKQPGPWGSAFRSCSQGLQQLTSQK